VVAIVGFSMSPEKCDVGGGVQGIRLTMMNYGHIVMVNKLSK
jgi:putative protein kinase ArgK-like GTPase of G3E family